MSHECIDTNVIVRLLVERPETINLRFKGVFSFFAKLEKGVVSVHLPDIVLFQSFFVLTSYYGVPQGEAAEKLEQVVRLKGISMAEKSIAMECLRILQKEKIEIVDAWILSYSAAKGLAGVYSFDADFTRQGLKQLTVA
jgi:predicted nucleic-acid-binding protein